MLLLLLLRRYWLQGPKAGSAELFMDNLPGPPDGISKAGDGTNYWVTIYLEVRVVTDEWLPV